MDEDFEMADGKRIQSASEDGEINDSDSSDGCIPRKHATEKQVFNANANSTTHSIFDDGDLAQMEERAQRFGLNRGSDSVQLDVELKELYKSLSIIDEQVTRHTRFDSIYLHGTEKMNTNDVFEYFFTHKPIFLEWINENSCVIVWKDDISAARALVFYSKTIKEKSDANSAMELENDGDVDMGEMNSSEKWGGTINASDIPVPVPFGKWRLGAPHPKAEYLFLRFANKSDIQASGIEKLKVYSKKYVGPKQNQLQTGIISESMKSKIKAIEREIEAIDEEKSKNPWGELCETWGIYDSQEVFGVEKNDSDLPQRLRIPRNKISGSRGPILVPHNRVPISERLTLPKREAVQNGLQYRLGKRRNSKTIDVIDDSNSEGEDISSSDGEWTKKNKFPRMRMHADDEQEKINKVRDKVKIPRRPYDDEDINNITVQVKNERPSNLDMLSVKTRLGHDRSNKLPLKSDLRSRLGVRRDSLESDSDEVSSAERRGSSVTVNKVKSFVRPSVSSTVWSRLDISENSREAPSSSGSDLDDNSANHIKLTISKPGIKPSARPGFEKVDLRSRLGKKTHRQRSPLRIEVDNELCVDSDEE